MRLALSLAAATLMTGLWVGFGASAAQAAATLAVGPGKMYAAPCAAFAAASDGDIVQIDAAGNYAGDVCSIARNNLAIRGVGGGRAHIDAAGKNAGGKGTWVITGNNTTVENIEFSGATVVDQNGAGIRQEGTNLTIRNCFFHDNDDGILVSPNTASDVLIERSEFGHNGFGDGFSHNMYIGKVHKFTLQFSYTHHAKIGHNVKTRANENHILYNRIMDEVDGTSSYSVDVSYGGTTFLIGNLIQQGLHTDNPTIVAYGAEGISNAGTDLYVVGNTFANDMKGGTFLQMAAGAARAVVRNNIFAGAATVITQPDADLTTNYTGLDPQLVDRAAFDYHLGAGSPCVNAGSDPGMSVGGVSLAPLFQYVHPLMSEARLVVGVIDIGAYELSTSAATDAADANPSDGRPADGSGDASDGSADGAAGGTGGGGFGGFGSADASGAGGVFGGGEVTGGSGLDTGGGCGCRAAAQGGGPHQPAAGDFFTVILGAAATTLARRRRRPVSDRRN
ncbi:MAG: hypothetical protein QOI66_2966 [Myxococcales bacterium]|nr:hypothetical protein [Myxococcales bacterium]